MPYRARLLPGLARRIAHWALPDPVLVEVYLRLREVLPTSPAQHLLRSRRPVDGMVYRFSLIDPGNRLREHFFNFQVFYGQDEETLLIARGAYVCVDGV
jgi:hypothetical protein